DDGSGEIVTLDAATGKRSGPTFTLGEFTQSVSTNSDGSRVLITATDTDAQVMTSLYDGSTGELLKTTGPEVWGGVGTMGPITRLTDRGEIISLSETRLTRFDATTFEPIGALAGTSGGFAYIGVSADGRTLSAFAQNGTVSLYDLVDGIRLGDPIPAAYPDRLSGFLRPDGMELAVNADDGIAMWDLDPEAHAQAACRIAGRDLTRDEWNTYLADVGEYRSTCGFADQHG
ncbi:MAG TPA: hypothetical protein VFM66_02790, partial [Agromyces sp.]|nr:hypothetical protein [Agromyces sp.]